MNIIEKQGIITTWFNEFLTQRNFNILEKITTMHCIFHSINNGTKRSNIFDRRNFEEFMVTYWLMIHTSRWVIDNLIEKEDYILVEYTEYLTCKEEFAKFFPKGQTIKETGIMKFHFMDDQIEKIYREVNSVV
ncbi:hypothetical protein [Bacillus cereus]|uniref:hypothetical protein n=1 Tax=Bacillus cereus TaxID=1396 RepID=UPI000B4ABADB|nr:hypothetical protein [Bacillus cereus]